VSEGDDDLEVGEEPQFVEEERAAGIDLLWCRLVSRRSAAD
jgi:hypothetical protein